MAARNACRPAAVKLSTPQGVLKPALQSGDKPNFIVILSGGAGSSTADQDSSIAAAGANTDGQPEAAAAATAAAAAEAAAGVHILACHGDNSVSFYVTPQCAQSRAALLTGRYPPRAGWDYINSGEATAGEVMSAAGYHTAHYGKWHNGRTLGYEPWTVGFQDSWFPSSEFEDALMRSRTGGPFKGKVYRSYPKEWRDKYDSDPKYAGIASATKDAWAMLEWLDGIYGRLFSFLESSPLGRNTYVMIMSDNGPQLLFGEKDGLNKMRRMPSNMEGAKSLPYDGGIRNFLAVHGPGVQAGVVDSTLLGLVDILPTVADLAGVTDAAVGGHLPWDGLSFKNLLATDSSGPEPSALRGSNLSNKKQQDRILFTLVPHCWDADAVPELDENREVNRSQLMLEYDRGGVPHSGYGDQIPGMKPHPGFQMCIAARYRDYKWMGFQPDTVYE
uniref:Sulfatase N-terminal domain-containing protein n=1 Tax=Tetradesmus obliquus TaxID=3088 RepID=A0A383WE69_TETOB|eukprot:jgi/Sobl393_1/5897/SZX75462.1